MMRCYSCNCILTPQESVRKFKESGTYTELCSGCLSTISDDVDTIEGDYEDGDYDDEETEQE